MKRFCGLSFMVAASLTGCGDDVQEGGPQTEGSTSTGEASSTTLADSSSSGSTSDASTEDSTTGASTVVVRGTIKDLLLNSPIAGAEISVFEDADVATVSDDEGNFELGPLEPGSEYALVVVPALVEDEPAASYFGSVVPVATEDGDSHGAVLTQLSQAILDMQVASLEETEPTFVEPDLTRAMVVVMLENNTALQDGPVEIEIDPAPEPDTYYAPSANSVPVLNSQTMAFSTLPVVVYYNLPDYAPGDLSVTATHPTRTCSVLPGLHPTLGSHITIIRLRCL